MPPARPSPSPITDISTFVGTVRALARRHRAGRLALTVVLAVIAASGVLQAVQDADERAASWGAGDTVWVATEPIAAGEPLTAQAVARRTAPPALRPLDAVTDDPVGDRTTVDLMAGEVIRQPRLASAATSPAAARLPPGWIALAVPGDDLPADIGDRVVVYDLVTGQELTAGAVLTDRTDTHLIVGLSPSDARRVVRSLGAAGSVVALQGPAG